MKKFISFLLLIALTFCFASITFSSDEIIVTLDGVQIDFDVKPQIYNGRTMVPVRAIFENMGAVVSWDEEKALAICTKGNTVIKFQENHMDMYINDRVVWMDIPAFVRDGRLLVPVRYVAEALGGIALWDEQTRTVAITSADKILSGKTIVVDAGHGIFSQSKKEAVAPGSSETKAAFVSGTTGERQTEEQLNLAVAFKLKNLLESKGATVHMTRTEHKCNMSNIDRAVFANNLSADISVKIHADGSATPSAHGVSVLVPGDKYIKDASVLEKSRQAGEFILASFVQETGAKNRGISVRNDMTGFNWSTVPVVLVELGFMTNPEEDKRMETEEYQNKMVSGIVQGVEKYFVNLLNK